LSTARARLGKRPKSRQHAGKVDAEFRLPAREEAALIRQLDYLDDRSRHLIVSSFGPRFVLYYDAKEDVFTWNDPTGGTLFKRRSMAAAVARLLGARIEVVECKVDKKGLLVKKSVRVGRRRASKKTRSRAAPQGKGSRRS